MKKLVGIFILTGLFSIQGFAKVDIDKPRLDRGVSIQAKNDVNEKVTWLGKIQDDESEHDQSHEHKLSFIRQENGKAYDVQIPELRQMHHETDKNFLVEIQGEVTPKFLFWGGNLILRSVRILQKLDGPPHHEVRTRFRDRERFRFERT